MATSLMYDSAYAYDISKNLIAMAGILFIDYDSDTKSIREDMLISDEDVDAILEKEDDQ
jgi:phosphate:Na+ symporter